MNRFIYTLTLSLIFLIVVPVKSYALENDAEFDDEFSKFESEINKGSIKDPFEKYNRKIFKFNEFVDKNFTEKIALKYRKIIPKPARRCVRNFLVNLTLPMSAFNSFAQGKTDNGFATISSFLINSTLGIAGLFEISKVKGIKYENEDFGQTLGYYGIESNVFLVLPFLGPSNLRDLSGTIIDRSIDPVGFNALNIGGSSNFIESRYRATYSVANVIDIREEILDIVNNVRKDSFDPYSTFRSAYLQRRLAQIEK